MHLSAYSRRFGNGNVARVGEHGKFRNSGQVKTIGIRVHKAVRLIDGTFTGNIRPETGTLKVPVWFFKNKTNRFQVFKIIIPGCSGLNRIIKMHSFK